MKRRFYIGTYTEGPGHCPAANVAASEGIYSVRFDDETGALDDLRLEVPIACPSFLAWHPSQMLLYAVTEAPVPGFVGGAVNLLRRDPDTDALTLLDRRDTKGLAPCHIMVEPQGRFLVVSNYRGDEHGGNFALFPLDPDGSFASEPVLMQGAGSGPNPRRQEKPHAHSARFDPVDSSILMLDLGLDTVFLRRFDSETGRLEAIPGKSDLKVAPGSGCRHAVFSGDGTFLCVIGELDSSVTVFVRSGIGAFHEPSNRFSTLPAGVTGGTASAICLHPSGRTLYASNRGHGGVAVFSVSETDGSLRMIQCRETRCKTPRFCDVDATGRFFFVCGQDNAAVDVLRIDPDTGRLGDTAGGVTVDSPVALLGT